MYTYTRTPTHQRVGVREGEKEEGKEGGRKARRCGGREEGRENEREREALVCGSLPDARVMHLRSPCGW